MHLPVKKERKKGGVPKGMNGYDSEKKDSNHAYKHTYIHSYNAPSLSLSLFLLENSTFYLEPNVGMYTAFIRSQRKVWRRVECE